MAAQGYGFDKRSAELIAKTVRREMGMLPRAPQVKRRRYDNGNRKNSGFSDGASCACCEPTNCASYTQPLSTGDCATGPFGWEVNFGSAVNLESLCSGLTSDDNGNYELEFVSYGVWRSGTFLCLGSALTGGCNDELATDCCTGEVTYTLTSGAWVSGGDGACSAGCTEPSAVPTCLTNDSGSAYNEGDTQTRPCTDITAIATFTRSGSTWVRTGGSCPEGTTSPVTNPDSSCDGETYEVPCCGDTTAVGSEDQYSYIQLTVDNTRDSENRSLSKLELIVGGVAAFTYVLPIGRDFCCECEQKFELKCCGPWAFRYLPESLCLKPMTPLDFDELYVDSPVGFTCCGLRAIDDQMPRFYEFEIALTGTAGCCAGNASGTFVLEWDDGLNDNWTHPTFVQDPPQADCREVTDQTFARWRMGCTAGTLYLQMVQFESSSGEIVTNVEYRHTATSDLCDDTAGLLFTVAGTPTFCTGYPSSVRLFPMVS